MRVYARKSLAAVAAARRPTYLLGGTTVVRSHAATPKAGTFPYIDLGWRPLLRLSQKWEDVGGCRSSVHSGNTHTHSPKSERTQLLARFFSQPPCFACTGACFAFYLIYSYYHFPDLLFSSEVYQCCSVTSSSSKSIYYLLKVVWGWVSVFSDFTALSFHYDRETWISSLIDQLIL